MAGPPDGLRLPRYALTSRKIPISRQRLFLGKGFRWLPIHTQRLYDCLQPEAAPWLRPGWCHRLARHIEKRGEHTLPRLTRLLSTDHWLNPVRPLPPVGGNSWLHGVELKECDVTLQLSERPGHTLVLGTTRVGKTRLAELVIALQPHPLGNEILVLLEKGGNRVLMANRLLQKPFTALAYTLVSFMLRLVWLSAMLPLICLCVVIGLTDGLVQRDLRRFGSGLESVFLHLYIIRFAKSVTCVLWWFYLVQTFYSRSVSILLPTIVFSGVIIYSCRQFQKVVIILYYSYIVKSDISYIWSCIQPSALDIVTRFL